MQNRIAFFLVIFFFVSCSNTRSVVRTTKPSQTTTRKPVAQNSGRTSASSSGSRQQNKTATSKIQTTKDQKNVEESVVLEATTKVKVTTELVLNYIETYKEIAKDNMRKNGIPASITMGQAILESGAGTGPLSVQANNHFGIKCHKEWTGPSIKHDDDEAQECFRKYDDPAQSFRDHSYFLVSRPRYADLFKLEKDDYKGWARGLRAAGYATDIKYPDKLIGLIERYQLQRFDAEVLGKEYVYAAPSTINQIKSENTHTVVKGDTLYSLSKRYDISIEDLKRKNNLPDSTLSLGQQLIVK